MPAKIKHRIYDSVEYKRCSKCKRWKNIIFFGKCSRKWDNLSDLCKECSCKRHKQYYNNNKLKVLKRNKQHRLDNIETYLKKGKLWRENNKKIAIQWRKNNPDYSKRYCEQWNFDNKDCIKKASKTRSKKLAKYITFAKRLSWCEEIRRDTKDETLLQVKCAYCGQWLHPTVSQVSARLVAIGGSFCKENRFYCSDGCKQACPIYRRRLYPKGFKKATSREVVPLLRQLVLERDDYTCQKCGATTEIAQLHVHHILSYMLNKMMANDPDNCITLCKDCHKEAHSQDGCRYNELKC